jgi:hypothetical protein
LEGYPPLQRQPPTLPTPNEPPNSLGGFPRPWHSHCQHIHLQRVITTRWRVTLPFNTDRRCYHHQRVVLTRWWVFLSLPGRPPALPTSNESSRLVGGFPRDSHLLRVFTTRRKVRPSFHPPPTTLGESESPYSPFHDDRRHYDHQRAFMARWGVSSSFQHYESQRLIGRFYPLSTSTPPPTSR